MIKRITHVKNFRCYQDWRHTFTETFEKLNLIYAPNGTGKSTFAELLSGVPGDSEWSHGMRADIQTTTDGSSDGLSASEHWIWEQVRLFNAEYVRRNLRFDAADGQGTGADAPALLHLGEPDIEDRRRREAAESRLQELGEDLKTLEKTRKQVSSRREELCTGVGRAVNRELKGKAPRFDRRFDKRDVKEDLHRPLLPWDELDRNRDQDRALLNTDSQQRIAPVEADHLSVVALRNRIAEMLGRTAASQVIEQLKEEQRHQAWVERGVELHQELDTCLFCEGAISEQRRQRLGRHFDQAYIRLGRDIENVITQARALHDDASRFLPDLPHRIEFFEDLREDFDSAVKGIDASITLFLSDLERVIETLERKKGEMFSPMALSTEHAQSTLDLGVLNQIIAEHNRRADDLAGQREAAAQRAYQHMLHGVKREWKEHGEQEEELEARISEAKAERSDCLEVLRGVPVQGLDPHFLTTILNNDLRALLRRDELTFEHRDGRYQVLRHASPARHLSEGEKTAIALLYFLQSLKEKGQDPSRLIIVVDDPVSSLDDQLIIAVQSMLFHQLNPLEEKPGCRQLFVLTHNSAFLRRWSDALKQGRGNPKKRTPATATLHIMKSRRTGPSKEPGSRHPVLVPVDLTGKDVHILDSEYNRLFYQAAHDLLNARYSIPFQSDLRLLTDTANSTRKLLEHFLQFSHPNQASKFRNGIERALKSDPIRSDRIRVILNSNSHPDHDPENKELVSEEAQNAIIDVFLLVKELHPEHFDGMCSYLGLDQYKARLTSF